jgi:hypothetical protein
MRVRGLDWGLDMKVRLSGSFSLSLPAVAVAALLAGSLPVTIDLDQASLVDNAAFAGNGNGNNGNGGGNGGNSGNAGNGGNSGNSGNAGASADAGNSGNANGHNKGDLDGDGIDDAHASDLGRLNAAHASDKALENANENSAVGNIAGYSNNVQEGNLIDAATDFGEAANKSVTEAVVHAVNELLGIDDSPVGSPEGEEGGEVAEGEGVGDTGVAEGEGEADVAQSDDAEGSLTVHDTETEVSARVNGNFGEDGFGSDAEPAHDG